MPGLPIYVLVEVEDVAPILVYEFSDLRHKTGLIGTVNEKNGAIGQTK